ncbi:MAG: hypothetical protein KatS3mg027_2491 [Bacteroidia bacterium]|nr:MAG: hypothetical protein KatS3mg027_2491 [Bacteroidia bacterium]
MNILSYLKYLNYKSQIKLDSLAIEDLSVEIQYKLANKNYNDYLIKKTCLHYFLIAVRRKKKELDLIFNQAEEINTSDEEKIKSRIEKINQLKLKHSHKKILCMLVLGYTYKEIREELNLTSKQLRNVIYYFKNTLKYKTIK